MIHYVELTGNSGVEEIVRAIGPILQKNRGEIGGMIEQLSNVQKGEVPFGIIKQER